MDLPVIALPLASFVLVLISWRRGRSSSGTSSSRRYALTLAFTLYTLATLFFYLAIMADFEVVGSAIPFGHSSFSLTLFLFLLTIIFALVGRGRAKWSIAAGSVVLVIVDLYASLQLRG